MRIYIVYLCGCVCARGKAIDGFRVFLLLQFIWNNTFIHLYHGIKTDVENDPS